MNFRICLFLFIANFTTITAQIDLPAASPLQKIEQTVGLSTISVEYSRPYMRGRKIFGGLEPYEKLWRTGANRCTKITFSDPVYINQKLLEAGTYALITRPDVEAWTVYFYNESSHWDVPEDFSTDKVAADITVPVQKTLHTYEMLSLSFENITPFKSDLAIAWENTKVEIPINMTTAKIINETIDEKLAGPDMGDYYLAAKFKLLEKKDLDKATEWINKSIELSKDEPKFWTYSLLAKIQAAKGDLSSAIITGEKALAMAKAENHVFYIKQIEELLAGWR